MDEMDYMDALLGDVDKLEGKQVCESCGKPIEEDKKEATGEPEVKGGMKVTIEPMSAGEAKEEAKKVDLENLKDEEPDEFEHPLSPF